MRPRFAGVVLLVALGAACDRGAERAARELTGGEPRRGRDAIAMRGCGSCHDIPGVSGANGRVGPPLGSIALRVYLAGQLPNTPENMMRWIRDPHGVEPGTAMVDTGVTEEEARDIAAYLYTLR